MYKEMISGSFKNQQTKVDIPLNIEIKLKLITFPLRSFSEIQL